MEINYKVGDNGKPRVNFSKDYSGLTQYNHISSEKFNIGKVTLFLAEYNLNNPTENDKREFVMSLRQDGRSKNIGEYRLSQMKLNKDELIDIRNNINKMLDEEILDKEETLLGCKRKYIISYFKGGNYKEITSQRKYIEKATGVLINYDSPFTGRFFLENDNGALEIIPMASVIEMREVSK